MNSNETIRVIAFCILIYNNKLLLSKSYDNVNSEYFYRPLGGGLEFGEKSIDAVKREFQEEVNEEIKDLKLMGIIENIFIFKAKKNMKFILHISVILQILILINLSQLMG